MHIRQPAVNAVVPKGEFLVVNSEETDAAKKYKMAYYDWNGGWRGTWNSTPPCSGSWTRGPRCW